MGFHPFKVIGIGATFSPNLQANLYEAARLSLFFEAKLVIIHVGQETSEKQREFVSILENFINDGLCYEVLFSPGDPVEAILSASKALHIDLLIIGALQRENFVNYYMGSIARKITRKSSCSVLLLIKPSIKRVQCKHIVVNGLQDPRTQRTLKTAFYVGHQLKVPILTIVEEILDEELHMTVDDDLSLRKVTIEKERLRRREDRRVQELLNDIPEEIKGKIIVKTRPIFGKRGYSIGHYAELVRADLLIMNAPPRLRFWDRLFPHDIEHILTELPTDVLVVR